MMPNDDYSAERSLQYRLKADGGARVRVGLVSFSIQSASINSKFRFVVFSSCCDVTQLVLHV